MKKSIKILYCLLATIIAFGTGYADSEIVRIIFEIPKDSISVYGRAVLCTIVLFASLGVSVYAVLEIPLGRGED